MLTVVTWEWGNKYDPTYVYKLRAGVRRHLKQLHQFIVVTDDVKKYNSIGRNHVDLIINCKDPDLMDKGCFCRLRMFDPYWQRQLELNDRIVCIDLDNVITGPLDPLFDRPEPFVVLQGVNAVNPCPYNCSLFMLRSEAYPEVWRTFSLVAAAHTPHHEFPDDQGWLWHKIPNAAGWTGRDGVYAFEKPGWPGDLPAGARIVAFPGKRDPSHYTKLPWVAEHWRV